MIVPAILAAKQASKMTKSAKKTCCHYGPTNTYIVSSPIGNLVITSCPSGLHTIHSQKVDNTIDPVPDQEVALIQQQWQDNGYSYKPALQCVEWLSIYFKNPSGIQIAIKPPICTSIANDKGPFHQKAWLKLLSDIPIGQSISYSNLAKLCGSSGARAVGSAMKNNPIMILVPCHRVINADGTIGQYSGGGPKIKKWLLHHEGVTC